MQKNRLYRLIDSALEANERVLVAIDGDAAAGKSTLAAELKRAYDCNVIHMDDFFLPPNLRTQSRAAEPGGNVDYERFKKEALEPLLAGQAFAFRPFDCGIWDFGEEIAISPGRLTIVEGAYSMHPTLVHAYDIKIFVKIDPAEQMRRIEARNGPEAAEKFRDIWIPMEKRYQVEFSIEADCDLVL
ncbi:MAG: uridine kinase [Clostridiales bacterium]|nr:uridine kinase [Clostridiales bacterium]